MEEINRGEEEEEVDELYSLKSRLLSNMIETSSFQESYYLPQEKKGK